MMRPDQLPGVSPAVRRYVYVALALVVGAIAFMVSRCTAPAPPVQMLPTPAPAVKAQAIASSSATAMGTQGIRVTIRRKLPISPSSGSLSGFRPAETPDVNGLPITLKSSRDTMADGSPTSDPITPPGDDWEVTIEATQSVIAQASSSAIASASVEPSKNLGELPGHGRLGVIAATVPGVAAVDLEIARIDLPSESLIGLPLELGLDVGGNPQAGMAGVSLGSKAFVEGMAWSRWDLSSRGLGAAVGLRF